MKKMSVIKYKWLSFLERSVALILFTCCFAGLQSVNAQIIMDYEKNDTTCTVAELDPCNGEVNSDSRLFKDEGGNDGNYVDLHERVDTVEICPEDPWHRVKVIFTDFDIAEGDTLFAWNGDKEALRAGTAPGAGSGSGVGVSKFVAIAVAGGTDAGGAGWVQADCDPYINPSGCLTFVFQTNGDNVKGTGWEAWVDCEERDIEIQAVNIPSHKLKCDETYAAVTIPAPIIKACGTTLTWPSDTVRAIVRDEHGNACIDMKLKSSGGSGVTPASITRNFAIGNYSVEYILVSDPAKKRTVYFSIQGPSLVCNDEVEAPLGAACMITLTPDDILEAPCDTIADIMYYNITVTLGFGKDAQVIRTKNFDNHGAVTYPIITAEDVEKAGMKVCDAVATVKIERIYYGLQLPAAVNSNCERLEKKVSCETVLRFFDEVKPWISFDLDADTLIACDTTGLDALLSAKGVDNCTSGDLPVTYSVVFDELEPCFNDEGSPDTTTATIHFETVDDCGNVGTASTQVTIIRPDIEDPDFVAQTGTVTVECTDEHPTPRPGVKIGIWKNNKFSVKDTVELSEEEYICGYILHSEEEPIPANDCGKKLYKYWYALDWCHPEGGPKRIDTTFIEYTDETAPEFEEDEPAPIDIELDHFSCTFDITKLAGPKATDNCSTPTVRLDQVSRIEDGEKWAVSYTDLECDSFCLRWIAEDLCHEQLVNDTVYQIVVIKDVTKPSAVCTDQLNVSLPNEWGARVCVEDIDAGSFDACGIKSKEIRIKHKYTDPDEGWTECIDIGCEYVHPDLQIEMRVIDNKDNVNYCWLDIIVEDKINPICDPLPDLTKDCDDYHTDELGASTDVNENGEMDDDEWVDLPKDLAAFYIKEFGSPVCEDNLKTVAGCGELTIEQQYQLIAWPCGEIRVKRRYRAKDWSGNYSQWAEQKITLVYKANWKVTFPDDWDGLCGSTEVAPDITIVNGACDLLGVEVKERRFDIPGDACFKIERTYHVINWCKYVAGDEPVEIGRVEGEHGFARGLMITNEDVDASVGYFTYVQVLKVHDDEAPVVTVIDPDPCINGVQFDALPYGEEDETPGAEPFECDEEKTWTATATDCSDPSAISWVGQLYDKDGNVVKRVETNELTYVVSNKETYYAEFWAYDGCGNSGGGKGESIKFWDCKKPTPYVLNGVAVELMQTGNVGVWATDLDRNSFDNCTDQAELDLRIWHASLGDAPTDLDGVLGLPKVVDLDCKYIGTQVINIYVIDEEKNWDYAATYVIVQDNMGVCGGDPVDDNMVAGYIQNPNGENIESVGIAINGGAQRSMTTASDGHFQFMLPNGGNYSVTPTKDINPLNGVSTFDLVLISKHILGISEFDTPYKYIAADVNKSGTITAFDMVQVRQLILGITNDFPNNDSWRFVDATYSFTSANPASEAFGEFVNIDNLTTDMPNVNFIGVKVGDINGNALVNSLLGAEVRSANGALSLVTADRFVEAGQTVKVDFTADMSGIEGYQFTMNLAGLELVELVEGVSTSANFNTQLAQRGLLTTSWNGEADSDSNLFGLTFKATASGLLSDMLSVSSDYTAAEAYNNKGDLLDVSLDFTTGYASANFELKQNNPNPFNGETVIGFNLPEAGAATLKVMDVQGKVLKAITAEYARGYHQVILNAKELGSTGVLYYQLESKDKVATKKMIIIE